MPHNNGDRRSEQISPITGSSSSNRPWEFTAKGQIGPGIERKPTGADNSSLKDTDKILQTRDKAALSQSPAETGNKPDLKSLARVAKAALSQSPAETGNKPDYQYLARDVHDWIKSFKESFSTATEKEAKIHNFAASIYNFAISKLRNSTDLSLIMPIELGLRGGSEATNRTSSDSEQQMRMTRAINTLEIDFQNGERSVTMRFWNALLSHSQSLEIEIERFEGNYRAYSNNTSVIIRQREYSAALDAMSTAFEHADNLVEHLREHQRMMQTDEWASTWSARRDLIREDIEGVAHAARLPNLPPAARNTIIRFGDQFGLVQD